MANFSTHASACLLLAKFGTNASGPIWWPNLELMQVEPPLAGEITQVRDAIPWVCCASGNVYSLVAHKLWDLMVKPVLRCVATLYLTETCNLSWEWVRALFLHIILFNISLYDNTI